MAPNSQTLKKDPSKRPDVTIVIPSYRSERTLGSVLERLAGEAPSAVGEILVVESGDSSAVAEICGRFPSVRLMTSPGRLSPGAARNRGARSASGDYLLFLDADCVPAPGWGAGLTADLATGRPVVSAAIGNGTPASLAGSVQFWLEFMDFSISSAGGPRPFISSYCLLIRRDDFLAANGFPEDYFMGEDIIFSHRLGQGEIPLFFSTRWHVLHQNRTSFRLVLPHLYRLGWWSSRVRFAFPEIRGSFLRRSPVLIPILVPFRHARLCRRLFSSTRPAWHTKIILALLAWPALTFWCTGFMKGMIQARRSEKRRPANGSHAEPPPSACPQKKE